MINTKSIKNKSSRVPSPFPNIYCVDLFCGAGGTTTGIERSRIDKRKFAKVVYCINHDTNAIASHKANHPQAKHAIEDIRTHKLDKLIKIIQKIREKDPNAVILLWASLECTNFSKAKGGLPRYADSRTLADHLFRYMEAINQDMIWIENVEEFQSWGPLDESGKPIEKLNGQDFIKWVEKICSYGYNWERRMLNAADFGAYTSRKRLFIQFNRPHIPIVWPEATHSKNPDKQVGLFSKALKKWKAVKEVLDLRDYGKSIFLRPKPLSEKTLERILAGLIKFVAGGKQSAYFVKYLGNDKNTGINAGAPIDKPFETLTTQTHHYLTQAEFLTKNNGRLICDAIESKISDGVVIQTPAFLTKYYSGRPENKLGSIDEPCATLTTVDRIAVNQPVFIMQRVDRQFGNDSAQSIDNHSGALLANPKSNMVTAERFLSNFQYSNNPVGLDAPAPTLQASRRYYYLLNPQYGNQVHSLDNPAFTLIARMDKAPPYIVEVEGGYAAIAIYDTDSPAMVKIKQFMAAYGIVDIKMRMLKIPELLRIQGFGDKYKLVGSQEQQKKYIGNSVVPEVVKAMLEATGTRLMEMG